MRLIDDKELFLQIIEQSSKAIKVDDKYIEKDYFAISILKGLLTIY